MSQTKPIAKGYIYSIGGGLLRYEGSKDVFGETAMDVFSVQVFTIVKPLRSVTREVKPWDKYKTGTRHNKLGHVICIYFSHEIFDLLTYEPTLTVLHGKDA